MKFLKLNQIAAIALATTISYTIALHGMWPTGWVNNIPSSEVIFRADGTSSRAATIFEALVTKNDIATCFFSAAQRGDVDVIQAMLLIQGVDVNMHDNNGNTTLHVAAYYGQPLVLQALLNDERTDQNIKNKSGQTARDMINPMSPEMELIFNNAAAKTQSNAFSSDSSSTTTPQPEASSSSSTTTTTPAPTRKHEKTDSDDEDAKNRHSEKKPRIEKKQ